MSESEFDASQFSPTELERLNTVMDAGSAELERLADSDVWQCLAVLEGTAEVSSMTSSTESNALSANRRFCSPRFVGSGAFGIVFLVFDKVLGIDVAIKLLRPSRNSPVVQQRFLEEAKITANLSHAGIIRLFDSGTIGQIPYITSALVSGGSLADWIAKHPDGIKPEIACRILLAVAEAVAFAHSKLTYHRDIKPSNILMQMETDDTTDIRPVLTDFGLAKRWDRTDCALTLEGDILGTSRYMSPEQASGALEDYSVASEVFTLGIVLHELLAGKVPFNGKSSTEIRRAIVQDRPTSLRQIRSGLSLDLIAIVQKCLEKSREQRYESVSALARDLQRYLAGQPVEASQPSLLRFALWNARKHPLATGSLILTTLTICLATTAIGYAWWNQYQSAKRERQTKIEYVILFGKLVDDVVAGEKDQQTAISDSLNGFEASLEKDLLVSPEDQDLRHLLSLVIHYQTITLERMGKVKESMRRRIDSVSILQKLRFEYPSNSKYRFQYLYGIAMLRQAIDQLEQANLFPYLASKTNISSGSEIVGAMVAEIDQLLRGFRKPDYENACNQFRLEIAGMINHQNPAKAAEMIQKVIIDATEFAKQHPETPTYIKPALMAHWQLAHYANDRDDGELTLKHAAAASCFFEQHLGPLFDKLWVRVLFLENEIWHQNVLLKYRKYEAVLAISDKCQPIIDELIENPPYRVSATSRSFELHTAQYLSFTALGQMAKAEEELNKLQRAARSALEFESTRTNCHAYSLDWKLPESVTSILSKMTKRAPD